MLCGLQAVAAYTDWWVEMALANDWSFQLGSVVVGPDEPLRLTGVSFGEADWRTQDTPNPVGDSRLFGDDYVTPGEWTLSVDALRSGSETAEDALATLTAAWGKKYPPNTMVKLTYRRAGVERYVWGRPRGVVPVPEKGIPDRLIRCTVRFSLGDSLIYGVDNQAIVMTLVPASTGGFTVPFTMPLIMGATGEIQGVIDEVGGVTPTPFVVKFQGPITNPWADGDNWRIALNTSIAYDQFVTVDTRTYEVKRSDGANLAGALTRTSRLSRARLSPGSEGVTFGGSDPTGTSKCTVSWNPAHNSI